MSQLRGWRSGRFAWLDQHHYLGSLKPVGQRLHYALTAANGDWLGVLVFCAAARRLANSLFMEWRSHQRKPPHHSTTDFTARMAAEHGRRVMLAVTARRHNLHSRS